VVTGQLTSTTEFGQIVLRANPNGSLVRLKDVARVEWAAQLQHQRAPERPSRSPPSPCSCR
jgi:multidrug efflux pump subunit AcrB